MKGILLAPIFVTLIVTSCFTYTIPVYGEREDLPTILGSDLGFVEHDSTVYPPQFSVLFHIRQYLGAYDGVEIQITDTGPKHWGLWPYLHPLVSNHKVSVSGRVFDEPKLASFTILVDDNTPPGAYYIKVKFCLGECTFWDWIWGKSKEVDLHVNVASAPPSCPDGQYWNGAQCVCPSGQEWNGQQCVTPTATQTVTVFSRPSDRLGERPSSAGDLGASIKITWDLNHVSNTQTFTTPFSVVADISNLDRQIRLEVVSNPPGWKQSCIWEHYGRVQRTDCVFLTWVFSGDVNLIVAFFDRSQTCPDGQYWNGAQCVCPSGQEWNGQQCVTIPPRPTTTQAVVIMSISDQFWNSWNPSSTDLGAPINVVFTYHGTQIQYAYRTTPFSVEVDQGTTIRVVAGSLSGWRFSRWNWYGDTYYHTDSSYYTLVYGIRPPGYDSNFLAALYSPPLMSVVAPFPTDPFLQANVPHLALSHPLSILNPTVLGDLPTNPGWMSADHDLLANQIARSFRNRDAKSNAA